MTSVVTFLGGPWDLHRVVMRHPIPPTYEVAFIGERWAPAVGPDPAEPVTVGRAKYWTHVVMDRATGNVINLMLYEGTIL